MKAKHRLIKKSMAAGLAVLMLGTGMQTQAATAPATYYDVVMGHWYYDSVMYVSGQDIMTGMKDGYFGVSESLARAQFAVILYRMAGEPEVAYDTRFTDVSEDAWFADAVIWANNNEIVTGYTDTSSFGPSDFITREQMAVMMYRYARYMGEDISDLAELELYPDAAQVSPYAKEGMQWAVERGLISGDNGKLNPGAYTNRAASATIITRFAEAEEEVYYPAQKTDGQEIVEFARQYVGKLPYVWGGTSLETGADCSGFVQSVYKKFDVHLKRTTYEQEYNGFEIPLSELQPGDLVFYYYGSEAVPGSSHHVAIYSGDGQVIHAINQKQGTQETPIIWSLTDGGTMKARRVL